MEQTVTQTQPKTDAEYLAAINEMESKIRSSLARMDALDSQTEASIVRTQALLSQVEAIQAGRPR